MMQLVSTGMRLGHSSPIHSTQAMTCKGTSLEVKTQRTLQLTDIKLLNILQTLSHSMQEATKPTLPIRQTQAIRMRKHRHIRLCNKRQRAQLGVHRKSLLRQRSSNTLPAISQMLSLHIPKCSLQHTVKTYQD